MQSTTMKQRTLVSTATLLVLATTSRSSSTVNAFVAPTTTRTSTRTLNSVPSTIRVPSTARYWKMPFAKQEEPETTVTETEPTTTTTATNNNHNNRKAEEILDELLKDGNKFNQAISHLQQNPTLDLSRERWSKVFDAIEEETARAEENTVNTRALAEYPPVSPSRTAMTKMYTTLHELNHLPLFGAVPTGQPPAAGSHIVTPTLLEQVTQLSMKSLTPKPTNTLLFAGIAFAVLEGMASVAFDINLNLLVFSTLALAFFDRVLINGAVVESILKVFSPGLSNKILRHEAGHFLCAYLLGCPVEGCVLDAWQALQDARFGGRRTGVSAGTSFFDPILSQQINTSVVTRSSIDRYSIIVMGGIAAEAINFGGADGGAGDEAALVAFLSQLNNNNGKGTSSSGTVTWNDDSIRNQARWGALQAVLLLKHYKVCYEALVGALEKGGNLGDCVYAIEEAGRKHNLKPLDKPLGYILDQGNYGEWTTELKPEQMKQLQQETPISASTELPTQDKLTEYKEMMKKKLRDIDDRLRDIES